MENMTTQKKSKRLGIGLLSTMFSLAVLGLGCGIASAAPVLTTQVSSPTTLTSIPVTVTFGAEIVDFNLSAPGAFSLTNNATVSGLTGTQPAGKVFNFNLIPDPASPGLISMKLNAGIFHHKSGSTNPASNVLSITFEAGSSCPRGPSYPDGCSEAPSGPPQHPDILSGYAVRPPWNVAGVDYAVGIPSGTSLSSWQTLSSNPGLSISGHQIRCQSGNITLNAIDFSAAGGAYIYIPQGGCSSLTITNSNWSCPSSPWPAYWLIQNQDPSTPVSVTYSSFDGAGCSTNLYAWIQGFNVVFEYNYATNAPVQILQATAPGSVVYKYNMIDNDLTQPGQHPNDQEWDGFGTISGDDVEYNSAYQYSPACGELFQFYNNTPNTSTVNPVFSNNTLIALPATESNNCGTDNPNVIISYWMQGTSTQNPTQIIGSALNQNNFFDVRGAYGAYYSGSLNGWTSSGNIDMTTGQTIEP